jgi:xylan 1,4-beta-xylosidase
MSHPISNPILPGFHPDPSIVRVQDDYYIANSTFEWFPGVRIHHSKDLVNWRPIGYALDRSSQLNMLGNPDSGGIWAPCLSYDKGIFYLVFTDVKRLNGDYKDSHNYLVTSTSIEGPWSEPIYLNSVGFDPSLFHDEDGRKWLVQMIWDPSGPRDSFHSYFAGIVIQEYCLQSQSLIGERREIFGGSSLGVTEGPHLYRMKGYYYLLTAEGGTAWDHACTLARSKNLFGPYEMNPNGHLLTSKDSPSAELQRSGHGDIVITQEGEVYLVHLCGRPLANRGVCPLGRETAIQKLRWDQEDWLMPEHGNVPRVLVSAPSDFMIEKQIQPEIVRDDFSRNALGPEYQWLRAPISESMSLSERPGFLRLKGRESIGSTFHQSLVARRLTSHRQAASCRLDFKPESFLQMAGLALYYNSEKFIYFMVTATKHGQRCLKIQINDNSPTGFWPLKKPIELTPHQSLILRIQVDRENAYASYRYEVSQEWEIIPIKLDASICSDEHGGNAGRNFTGAFFALCCQDLSGSRLAADFDWFEIETKMKD